MNGDGVSRLTLDAAGYSFARFFTMKAEAAVQLEPVQLLYFNMTTPVRGMMTPLGNEMQ